MLQRPQSVFLAIAAICLIVSLFLPVWVKSVPEPDKQLTLHRTHLVKDSASGEAQSVPWPYALSAVFAVLGAATAVFEIFKYNNRLTQMKLGALNSLLLSAATLLPLFFVYQLEAEYDPTTRGAYGLGTYLPLISLVCNILANRFIRRDEKLVRSVDRIR